MSMKENRNEIRRDIYEDVCSSLLETGVIKHVDLWNRNVEFIEQENNWERPAVFVEFDPIQWDRSTKENSMRTRSTIKLHIVTDWSGSASANSPALEDALDVFKYPAIVQAALEGLGGASYGPLTLAESYTNHDHEELIESIEVYRYRGEVYLG